MTAERTEKYVFNTYKNKKMKKKNYKVYFYKAKINIMYKTE